MSCLYIKRVLAILSSYNNLLVFCLQLEHARLSLHLYLEGYLALVALVKLVRLVLSFVIRDTSLLDSLRLPVEMTVDGQEIHLTVQVCFLSHFFLFILYKIKFWKSKIIWNSCIKKALNKILRSAIANFNFTVVEMSCVFCIAR